MDDYFNANNPSAFAEKKVYTSNTSHMSMYSSIGATREFGNFVALKQQIGSFSLGLNNEFSQWFEWKTISTTFNAAYSAKINRNLTLNTAKNGVGILVKNYKETLLSFLLSNPAYSKSPNKTLAKIK